MTGVVIPLAILIGFCEECAFRGLLPLFIAAKTGLPTAAVVALSGVIFGVRARAVSLGVVVVVLIAVAFFITIVRVMRNTCGSMETIRRFLSKGMGQTGYVEWEFFSCTTATSQTQMKNLRFPGDRRRPPGVQGGKECAGYCDVRK